MSALPPKADFMPEDGIVCLDNGMYKIWFARNYRTHVANTLLLDNALATMGAGLPSAIAAKLLNTRRRVMAVCGDGGFMMNSQELETAVRLELDLVREKSAHPKPPMKSSRAFAVFLIHRQCLPVRLSGGGRSFQFGRASALAVPGRLRAY
jgi:Thiamine pyrophosphate enzyme, C-terminal TPP binding domain